MPVIGLCKSDCNSSEIYPFIKSTFLFGDAVSIATTTSATFAFPAFVLCE